ncbi:hypothetical protein BT93_E0840 [Corymbia citriodora subsp. variegata]|nr:hypothetical protein BT93_E0840 [Corymbia citriodora subsp. variegata]
MESSDPTQHKQGKVPGSTGGALKEKRAKLYIIRKCVLMLLCWKEHGD